MQQNNELAAIVAVAKKKSLSVIQVKCPPETNKFRVKTFQAAQLTHKYKPGY